MRPSYTHCWVCCRTLTLWLARLSCINRRRELECFIQLLIRFLQLWLTSKQRVTRRRHETCTAYRLQQLVYTGVTSCDPSSLCVTWLCSQANIDVCRPYDLTLTAIFGRGERKFQGMKVPKSESSKERKFQPFPGIARVPGSESSTERKFQGTNVPGSESIRERKFHLWYFRSWERKYVGTKVPVTLHTALPWGHPALKHFRVALAPVLQIHDRKWEATS